MKRAITSNSPGKGLQPYLTKELTDRYDWNAMLRCNLALAGLRIRILGDQQLTEFLRHALHWLKATGRRKSLEFRTLNRFPILVARTAGEAHADPWT